MVEEVWELLAETDTPAFVDLQIIKLVSVLRDNEQCDRAQRLIFIARADEQTAQDHKFAGTRRLLLGLPPDPEKIQRQDLKAGLLRAHIEILEKKRLAALAQSSDPTEDPPAAWTRALRRIHRFEFLANSPRRPMPCVRPSFSRYNRNMRFLAKLILAFIINLLRPARRRNYFVGGFLLNTANWEVLAVLTLILTLLNFILKPILKLLLGPIIVLTLGLGAFLVNAVILKLLDFSSPAAYHSGHRASFGGHTSSSAS